VSGSDPWRGGIRRHPPMWNLPKLTQQLRRQIIDGYAVAQQGNPELSIRAFAQHEALRFGISAVSVRRVLYDHRKERGDRE